MFTVSLMTLQHEIKELLIISLHFLRENIHNGYMNIEIVDITAVVLSRGHS